MNAALVGLLLAQTSPGVSGDEARAVLVKLDTLARKVLTMPAPRGSVVTVKGAKPLTRVEIARAYQSLAATFEPKFKIAPKPVPFEPTRIRATNSTDRALLTSLVRGGWVAPFGPLATGRVDSLQPREFGDATAFFILRLMELTQTPSSKWSPMLHL